MQFLLTLLISAHSINGLVLLKPEDTKLLVHPVQGSLDGKVISDPESRLNFRVQPVLESVQLKGVYCGEVHNLTVGSRSARDRVLYQASIYKPYQFLRVVETDVVVGPSVYHNGELISLIEAIDTHPNQSDAGYAALTSGGPNTSRATIHLKSKRGHGLKYRITIWGH